MAQPAWDTLTRSEALALRGYSPEVIAGNGHVEAPPAPATNGSAEAPFKVQSVLSARVCSECPSPCRLAVGPVARRARPSALEPGSLPESGTSASSGRPGWKIQESEAEDQGVSNGNVENSTPEAPDLLALLVTVAGQLPPRWRAEVAAEGLSLRWAPGA